MIGAVEIRRGKKRSAIAGRVRLSVIPDATAPTLVSFVQDNVAPGTTVLTDGHGGYNALQQMGYQHRPEVAADLPLAHREFANLKTWLRETHHDRVERKHLQAYLNEFAFRHNRRFWPFSAFQRVLQIAMRTTAPTYRELYQADEFGTDVHVR